MASNFRIIAHRSCENLHLKLTGDFDGTSAWQLLHILKKKAGGFHRIIIHTGCLDNIYPFGLNTFHELLGELRKKRIRIFFTGEKADQVSPEKGLCI